MTQLSLHELDDTRGKGQFFRALSHIFSGEIVLDHELSKIANHFRRGRDFDDIAEQLIRFDVRTFDVLELRAETETKRLELNAPR